MAKEKQMIVIKKIIVAGAGHHGGSWKVALADFMTAMMAFFLVMWLLGQSEETKKAISDYLSCSHCPLKKLTIQNSDVNDYQCEKFITALQYNSTLLYLDLSNNKIGNAEALNVVKPNLITGGEAIAALLRCSKTEIKVLKLGWNYIRLHSAVDLANSLNYNKTLQYLDLSCNSLGRDGGETLGIKSFFQF